MSRPETPAPRRRPTQPSTRQAPRVALALAGGGPLGATFEIGALCALADALEGLDFNHFDHYVGVSAGGFVAAALANGITPHGLCATFIEGQGHDGLTFDPTDLMRPAYAEWARRAASLPLLLAGAAWDVLAARQPLSRALERLGPALPTGLIDNEAVHLQLQRLFEQPGRSNDFRALRARLTLVATHLNSGQAAPFGRPGWDHVPISRAVQASAALPGLFPPVEVDGQHYVDGALKKTVHATVALDEGMDLLICLNPLVPFDASKPQRRLSPRIPSLIEGGLPAVMSQTFRSLIHSRMELGFKHYERLYPDTDILLIEPDPHDAELFFANTFSYRQRREMAEHVYQQTRQLLRRRRASLRAPLARHGIRLRDEVLDDPQRHLIAPAQQNTRLGQALARLQDTVDELQHTLRQREASA
ncbi:patatin-like phospholipase family protein [Hydrogenophaga sp. OTU3427]|uniref:patatin-like phospholipase family protein n=1 Tax=Hydrogenophaga sp. OTU3427 TaxID=3043856 RepID=UPI00313E2BE0